MIESQTMRWSFKSSNVVYQGRVVRIAIYLQSKVLEMIDANDSVFYLIYFNNKLLGGCNGDQRKEGSFLQKAFQQGIQLSPTHPLFPTFLPQNRKAVIPNINTLFTELQEHLSLDEVALAATCMDSIIEKQQIIRVIREIFNHFKRNGQFRKAYHIAGVLQSFSPNTKAIKELARAPEFEKYRKEEVITNESIQFQNRTVKENEIALHQWLKQRSMHRERLILFIDLFEANHDFYNEQEFIETLHHVLNTRDQYATLKYVWEIYPDQPLIRDELFREELRLKQYAEAIALIVNQSLPISAHQCEQIESIIEVANPSALSQIPNMNDVISQLYLKHPEKKEKLVRNLSVSLLKEWPIAQLIGWLKPIAETTPHLPIVEELIQLESLSNDLDQLVKLGEIYYQFGLIDQSIECFVWEAELHPDSIDPLRWLSKLYKEKGRLQEAENYQQLAVLMAKKGY